MKVLTVFGTRPEAIKMAPVVHRLQQDRRFDARICVSGQHSEMLAQVNRLFGIVPDIDLDIMKPGQSLTHITTAILTRMEGVLKQEKPDYVLVHGDTTTSMAAALAAFYAGVRVGHVEAGLRTRNLLSPWPEEANRQITGRIADLHFAPTDVSRRNLLEEQVPDERIIVTGNTVIDALFLMREMIEKDANEKEKLSRQFGYLDDAKRLILVTGHRRENQDGGIAEMCKALAELAHRDDVEILYPVHLNPNVKSVVDEVLGGVPNVFLIEPQPYAEFVWLLDRAYLVVSDSGGIQEEAPSLGKPVLVTRANTERPEAIAAGTVKLVGTDRERLVAECIRLLDHDDVYKAMAGAKNPYGDGKAAIRIVERLARE